MWIDEPPTAGEILAIEAVTWFEMGLTADDARDRLLARWSSFGSPAGAFRDAVVMIPKLPQPIDEDAETAARRDEIMQALGGTPATEELAASLSAMELLRSLDAQNP